MGALVSAHLSARKASRSRDVHYQGTSLHIKSVKGKAKVVY